MTDSSKNDAAATKRRGIPLGEVIAIAALIVSAIGVWIAWKSSNHDQPTRVVEQRTSIPLTLRGRATNDGRSLEITPVEQSHALQALVITAGGLRIDLGSDGELQANALGDALDTAAKKDDAKHQLRLRIQAKYVEAGADKFASGTYTLTYRWEDGGFLGGRSLRLVGLSRG
jgi:hypothetical protein